MHLLDSPVEFRIMDPGSREIVQVVVSHLVIAEAQTGLQYLQHGFIQRFPFLRSSFPDSRIHALGNASDGVLNTFHACIVGNLCLQVNIRTELDLYHARPTARPQAFESSDARKQPLYAIKRRQILAMMGI